MESIEKQVREIKGLVSTYGEVLLSKDSSYSRFCLGKIKSHLIRDGYSIEKREGGEYVTR